MIIIYHISWTIQLRLKAEISFRKKCKISLLHYRKHDYSLLARATIDHPCSYQAGPDLIRDTFVNVCYTIQDLRIQYIVVDN